MNPGARGLVTWILLAAGTFLMYCAYTGYTPQSVLASFLNRNNKPVPFGHSPNGTGNTPAVSTGGGTVPATVITSPNSAAPKTAVKVQNV